MQITFLKRKSLVYTLHSQFIILHILLYCIVPCADSIVKWEVGRLSIFMSITLAVDMIFILKVCSFLCYYCEEHGNFVGGNDGEGYDTYG